MVQYMAYVEIATGEPQNLWGQYEAARAPAPNLAIGRIRDRGEIYPGPARAVRQEGQGKERRLMASERDVPPRQPAAAKRQMPLPLPDDDGRYGPPAPAMRRRASAPLPGGSEWTFDLIERYDREIARVAESYGLDTYPNQIEIITSEQMMDAYASNGMPVGYSHWSYGKQFLRPSRPTSAAAWASPTRSSSTPIRASRTSWRRTRCRCRRW